MAAKKEISETKIKAKSQQRTTSKFNALSTGAFQMGRFQWVAAHLPQNAQ